MICVNVNFFEHDTEFHLHSLTQNKSGDLHLLTGYY